MRIAFYCNNLDEKYQLALYNSVSNRAKQLGIDLICIQQERLVNEFPALKSFPSQKFIDVDGVILLCPSIMEEKNLSYEETLKTVFGKTPFICLSTQIDGAPSIIIRTENSMQTLMNHLLYGHRYKKFIFVGGPHEHQDNLVREFIFKKSIELAHTKDPSIEAQYLYGQFNEYIGMDVISKYIEKNPDNPADVIVCANDNMAIGVLRELNTLHDEKWEHCAVTGFDDIPRAKIEQPPLTTIEQPYEQMGITAVESIYKLINGQKVDLIQSIESKLKIRNSCGCKEEWDEEENSTNAEQTKTLLTQLQRERILTEQVQQHASYFSQRLNGALNYTEIMETLKAFIGNIRIQTFYLFLFSETTTEIPEDALLYFQKSIHGTKIFEVPQKVNLKEYFKNEILSETGELQNLALHYINSRRAQLGIIVYEGESFVHTQMCSLSILLGSTLNRMRYLEIEQNRSKELEIEVEKRTKEIVNANRQLEEESQRRIKVEAEVLKIGEQERMRFSMDLHDDICQRLAGISMMCKGMSAMQPDLQELSTLIDETLHRTRQYAHDSFPMELEALGMNEAIENLCNTVQEQSENKLIVKYKWDVPNPLPISASKKINIFRIIQEALHNTVKHAHATLVEVTIMKLGNNLVVTIKDNGIGSNLLNKDPSVTEFKTSSKGGSLKSVGIGLRSMYYRADQIGAKCVIKSKVGKGTTVSFALALN